MGTLSLLKISGCAFIHTKTPLTTIFLDKVSALDNLQQNFDDDIVGPLQTISQGCRVLSHLAALIHLSYQLLYESVPV